MTNTNNLWPKICFCRLGGSIDKALAFSDILPAALCLVDVTYTHTHTLVLTANISKMIASTKQKE